MFEKPNASQSLGLYYERPFLKGVYLSFFKGKPKLERVFEIPLSDHEDVKRLYIESDQSLETFAKDLLTVTALPSHQVLVRPLEIKLKKEKDIEAVLAFQAEPLLPYPLEQAIIDKIPLGKTEDGTLLTVLSVRKDHLTQHLRFWQHLQIEPEVIASVPSALAIFSLEFISSENPFFILDVGIERTTCLLIKEGKLVASQSVQMGIAALQEAFAKEYSGEDVVEAFNCFDFASLNSSENEFLFQRYDHLHLEVTRLLYSLTKLSKKTGVEDLLFTGSGALLPNFGASLSQRLHKKLLYPNVLPSFPLSQSQLLRFAVPIGCALSALPKQKDQVNFRQQEFIYPNPWRRLKKPLLVYFGLCLFLAFSFYLFGQAYLGYHEDELKEEYSKLLVLMNKPYHAYEEEYAAKFAIESDVKPLKHLTREELHQRLDDLEKEIQSSPNTFALYPNVPRVSDVLAWLYTIPSLQIEEGNSSSPPIRIESFAYSMVKRPDKTKPQEKYQVKVELEFSSSTPKKAREFHDALIAPNAFVDPKGEVKWSSNRGKYRTSFFLKDKTFYPT